ncbi:hypothetical protein CEXT_46351 [Caerostris extrusa]|uniref:Uncharacterized protein n=1 Tax=Caerostris extrusa TaxID=172846 RepID=A0AAV4MYY0_CAEEX|nr:hypothetical protein CEXT_46351 [Caerostris extrusa]
MDIFCPEGMFNLNCLFTKRNLGNVNPSFKMMSEEFVATTLSSSCLLYRILYQSRLIPKGFMSNAQFKLPLRHFS